MPRHLARIATHAITIRPATEPPRPDVGPAKATHYSRQSHGLAWTALHGHFKLIKHLMSGDALDAICGDLPLESAQHGLPGIFRRCPASCFRASAQLLDERSLMGAWSGVVYRHVRILRPVG